MEKRLWTELNTEDLLRIAEASGNERQVLRDLVSEIDHRMSRAEWNSWVCSRAVVRIIEDAAPDVGVDENDDSFVMVP